MSTLTHYFVVDSRMEDPLDPLACVTGPLSEEFRAKEAELRLPEFTKILKSLE